MHSTTNDIRSIENHRRAEYPAIAALRIADEDWAALSEQGFVCGEHRGDRKYYKLRFRRDRKQVVRYVGDADRAAAVERELSELQHEATVMRELKARMRIASSILRVTKRLMTPILEANGLAFHGLAIRRSRKSSAER